MPIPNIREVWRYYINVDLKEPPQDISQVILRFPDGDISFSSSDFDEFVTAMMNAKLDLAVLNAGRPH